MRLGVVRKPVLLCVVLGASCLAITGCGGTVNPVRGKVTFADGKPLANGRIVYSSPELKISANGEIQPDGSYSLSTHTLNDGAPEGNYTVTIIAYEPVEYPQEAEPAEEDRYKPRPPRREPPPKPLVALKYANVSTSDLTATVGRGENTIDFVVDPPK